MRTRDDRRVRLWPGALSLRSMRGRIALLLGLAMLPAGAIAMQVGFNAAAARQAAYEEALSRRAVESIATERRTIDELREMLRVVATTPALQRLETESCADWLSEIMARYPYIAAIAVTTNSGQILCSMPEAPADVVALNSDLRRRARARDGFTMGYLERGVLTGQPVLAALEPIREGGRRTGFVSASMATSELTALLDRGRAASGARAGRAAIVDSTGMIIAQSTVSANAPGLPPTSAISNQLGSEPAFMKVRGGDAVIVPLYAPDLFAIMSWAPDQPIWRRVSSVAFSIAAPLLIWLLAISAGWFAVEVFVARPLSRLETAARGYARGEDVPDSPALLSAPSEIRSLRRTLAAMAKTLRGRELRLVEALAEERALLRELNHRVKNNLQMVASLLNIQARSAPDDLEAWGLARAHDRVQLLALAHQRIYESGELRDIRIDDLVAEIARQLLQSRAAASKEVKLVTDLGAARASADHAVPLAFLIGEGISAVLDSLKDARAVELHLMLAQDDDGEIRFAIDAVGGALTPADANPRLIEAFARQLGASVGRNAQRPYMLWAVLPRLTSAEN